MYALNLIKIKKVHALIFSSFKLYTSKDILDISKLYISLVPFTFVHILSCLFI